MTVYHGLEVADTSQISFDNPPNLCYDMPVPPFARRKSMPFGAVLGKSPASGTFTRPIPRIRVNF